MKNPIFKFFFLTVFVFCLGYSSSFAKKIRIGTLQYGSVNWELKLIEELELDKKNSFELEIVELASKNAAAVALQGGSVDLIVTDWFWVSRQRNEKRLFSFIPHSMAAGGLIASKNSKIVNDLDLKNKKIGVAGGQVEKGWLIFRAYYKKKHGTDLIALSRPIFGAPPLLNKKMQQSGFDAILTYWPYQAKLLTDKNFKKVININEILSELGIPDGIPVIGWVFRDDWGKNNSDVLDNFLKASDEAKKIMLESDKIWDKIRPNMMAEDDLLFSNLREIYREGIPKKKFTKTQIEGAKKLYSILSKIGGKELVGNAKELSPGTFWSN
jgi:NitT/TauT family transport system substrate-binding protein